MFGTKSLSEYIANERKYRLARCRDYWTGFVGNKRVHQQELAALRNLRNWARS